MQDLKPIKLLTANQGGLIMETVGELLKQHRIKNSISIAHICDETKILKKYIEKIENNDFTGFPGDIYLEGFIKLYASFIGVNENKAIDVYKRNLIAESETPIELLMPEPKRKWNWGYVVISAQVVVTIVLAIAYG